MEPEKPEVYYYGEIKRRRARPQARATARNLDEKTAKYRKGDRTMIETRNRKLEQFYFLHGVDYVRWRKDDEGLTVWEYEDNEENRRIREEFRLAIKRREAQKEQTEKYQRVL